MPRAWRTVIGWLAGMTSIWEASTIIGQTGRLQNASRSVSLGGLWPQSKGSGQGREASILGRGEEEQGLKRWEWIPKEISGSCCWPSYDFYGQRIVLEGQFGLGTGNSLHGLRRGAIAHSCLCWYLSLPRSVRKTNGQALGANKICISVVGRQKVGKYDSSNTFRSKIQF